MAFSALRPHPALASLVLGYWFIEDLPGEHEGQPIRTTPHPAAVLTLNLGTPCGSEFAAGAPRASLLGVQSRPRHWTSTDGIYFVMVMLSPPGLARLFPSTGKESRDELVELGSLLGDATVRRLSDDLSAAWTPRRVAGRLDAWLLQRLSRPCVGPEVERLGSAWSHLRRTARVDAAARALAISPRQLERWFLLHTGHSPKQLLGLERVQASLRATQTGRGDPLAGFSDQSHQIRAWKRHLGMTPGQLGGAFESRMAEFFVHARDAAPEGLAHFL